MYSLKSIIFKSTLFLIFCRMFRIGIISEYFLENINKLNDPLIWKISDILNSNDLNTGEKSILSFFVLGFDLHFHKKYYNNIFDDIARIDTKYG